MKKTVTVHQTKTVTKKIEIHLPMYFAASDAFENGGYETWVRVNENLTAVALTRHYSYRDEDNEWELKFYKKWETFEPGLYYSESREATFNAALEEFRQIVVKL